MAASTTGKADSLDGDEESEALAILGAYAERVSPGDCLDERVAAARALLGNLVRIAGRLKGVTAREDGDDVAIAIGGREALLHVSSEEGAIDIRCASQASASQRLHLRYDRVRRKFVGWGQGPTSRDGLAVVAEAITAILADSAHEP